MFRQPIDPVFDKQPNYWQVVKQPMDLDTILRRAKSGWYDDINLMSAYTKEKSIEEKLSKQPSVWVR